MRVPDCADCLKAVQRASGKAHPVERAVEFRKQTENKLDVLADYYAAWPNTILSGLRKHPPKKPVNLWIIDLFAGRGWHETQKWPEGRRPGTAAAAGFRLWQAVGKDWGFEVRGHLVAIDADAMFAAELHASLPFQHPRLDIRVVPRNYTEVIDGLLEESLDGYSLWLFDPYGLESIPFCMIQPLLAPRKKTEVIVNLDAGNAQRVIDAAVQKHGAYDLAAVKSATLDCLFGGDDWRAIPARLTSTASRERWLAERYRDLFPATMEPQELPMGSSTGFTRFFIHAGSHHTAHERFKQSYDDVMRLWKRQRAAPKLDDMARQLAKELAGQEATPTLIQALGLFPGASLDRITGVCHHAFALGYASQCDPDGTVVLLPPDQQRGSPRGLFD